MGVFHLEPLDMYIDGDADVLLEEFHVREVIVNTYAEELDLSPFFIVYPQTRTRLFNSKIPKHKRLYNVTPSKLTN